MLETKYLYLYLLLFSISYPLAQSFEHRLRLYKNWKAIFTGIFIMSAVFIPWDIWFTQQGVWWFNSDYYMGYKISNLPIEECLFFVIVPYACVFIYEVLNYFIKKDIFKIISTKIFLFIGIILLTNSLINFSKLYTFTVSICALLFTIFIYIKKPSWLGRFLIMYFVSLIPFILVNGTLTGMLTNSPVVNYNPSEIIGFRIISIPVEDFIYNFLMMLIVIFVYEKIKK